MAKIGRKFYARRSDVLALVDKLAAVQTKRRPRAGESADEGYGGGEDHMAATFRKRDTHATWLALAGVPDKVIQRRMGHASPTTTDRYVKAAETFATDNVGGTVPEAPCGPVDRILDQK